MRLAKLFSSYLENSLSDRKKDQPIFPPTQTDLQVSENPYKLFRGVEYYLYKRRRNREPLTFYDMNLSSSEHQSLFPRIVYARAEDYESMTLLLIPEYFRRKNFVNSNAASVARARLGKARAAGETVFGEQSRLHSGTGFSRRGGGNTNARTRTSLQGGTANGRTAAGKAQDLFCMRR